MTRTATRLVAALLVLAVLPAWAGGEREYVRWLEDVQARGLDPDAVIYPFRVTPAMVAWADEAVTELAAHGPVEKLNALQAVLFDRDRFEFTYDERLTVTPEEAFSLRRGNCLSFTAMFIGLARALEVPATLVSVRKVPEVARDSGLVVVNRHVVAGYRGSDRLFLYDFYVTSSAPLVRQRVETDVKASAMFHANLGAVELRRGDLKAAERHERLATRLAPEWAPAWVNLGVVQRRQGRLDDALASYMRALEYEPDFESAHRNLAVIYRELGRDREAWESLMRAAEDSRNPFTLIAVADLEMYRGNLSRAAAFLRRARWWHPKEPAVYEALARLAVRRGEYEDASKYSLRANKLRQE